MSEEFNVLGEFKGIAQQIPEPLPWNDYFMAFANMTAARSSCHRLKVGSVLVKDKRIISCGYNGFLPGLPHQSQVRDGHEQATVHAEQNCISDCAGRGVLARGATVYVTHFPCINCTKIIIASGIEQVKYFNDYRNDPIAIDLLGQAGISVQQLPNTEFLEQLTGLLDRIPQRLGWNEYFMCFAWLTASRSVRQAELSGCVMVQDRRVISCGYNGYLPGLPHQRLDRGEDDLAIIHAAQNCISDCAKRGVNTDGAHVYMTSYPDINCTKILIASGVTVVRYCDELCDADEITATLLAQAGVSVIRAT